MRFSIITVNYNNKEGLQRTIVSVTCQTYQDYEWIVVDGGSSDGSKEQIERYQQHFSFWCSEPDKGVYNAMNKGIKHAVGDYLLFLNSGDALYDQYVLQKVSDLKSAADIISGQVVRMDNHELLRHYEKSIFMQLYLDTLNHQGTFIKRTLFRDLLYDESLKIVSDWKFWLDAILKGGASVDMIPVIVACQDMTGISSNLAAQAQEKQTVLDAYFPPLLQQEINEYQKVRGSIFYFYGEELKKKSHTLYAIGWRVLKLLSKL